jgi:hypothetical protein
MHFSKKLMILSVLIFTGILIFSFYSTEVFACEIEMKIDGESGEPYRTGDELILMVEVFLTHRNCTTRIEATEFTVEGMDVLGVTKWVETSRNHFQRFVKVKITATENGESIFYAKRTCTKEGGYGFIKLNVETV